MTENLITPVLALDFHGIWFIVVIVIAIISWLTNLANQKNPQKPPATRPPQRRPGGDKLSQEIDVFLQEVAGRKKPSASDDIEIEVVPENEVRRRPIERPVRPQQRPTQRTVQVQRPRPVQRQPQPAKPASVQPRLRPGQEIAERHNIDPSRLGTGLQDHLSNYMGADRIDQEVKQHLKPEVERSVQKHLGQFGASSTAVPPTASEEPSSQKAVDIVSLLRDRQGVRQAILINEVLGKPLALRQR